MPEKTTVILCRSRPPAPEAQSLDEALVARLAARPGIDLCILPHLYDLAPDGPGMELLRCLSGDMIVLARLYPRAAFWLLEANEISGRMGQSPDSSGDDAQAPLRDAAAAADRTIWCLDLRGQTQPGPLLEQIDRLAGLSGGQLPAAADYGAEPPRATPREIQETVQPRWYPVVDRGRCENCLECLNFCLFGTFGIDAGGRLFVEQPDACRDGCPACARVCPAQAIMFPEQDNPAIAGDANARPSDFDTAFVQLIGGLSAGDLAAVERNRALAGKSDKHAPAGRDDLDELVDDLDEMDL